MLRFIDRFGAQEVMGRVLGVGEMRRMMFAENLVNVYASRQASTNKEGGWGKWAQEHPDWDAMLKQVEKELSDGI